MFSQILSHVTSEPVFQPLCLSVESRPERDRDLNAVVASYFILGGSINWNVLYENRLVHSFVPVSLWTSKFDSQILTSKIYKVQRSDDFIQDEEDSTSESKMENLMKGILDKIK